MGSFGRARQPSLDTASKALYRGLHHKGSKAGPRPHEASVLGVGEKSGAGGDGEIMAALQQKESMTQQQTQNQRQKKQNALRAPPARDNMDHVGCVADFLPGYRRLRILG